MTNPGWGQHINNIANPPHLSKNQENHYQIGPGNSQIMALAKLILTSQKKDANLKLRSIDEKIFL